MKLSLEAVPDYNQIHSYNDDQVVIRQKQTAAFITLKSSFILMPQCLIPNWFAPEGTALSDENVAKLISLDPEVVILASGSSSSYSTQYTHLVSRFSQAGIGIEMMSLGPACRTYNLILSEDRQVLLAAIL